MNYLISASKIKSWNLCPKMLRFRYVLKIPWEDKEYFKIGRDTETIYCDIISWKREIIEDPQSEPEKLAMALYKDKKLTELVKDEELIFQKEYKTWDVIAYTDIETPSVCIDLKTSSIKWNKKTLEDSKYQAKMYKMLNWKTFYFAIVNKKTYEVQVIEVESITFDDLRAKIEEVKLAFKEWLFRAEPWFHCNRFCDYNKICDKKGVL